MVSGRYTYRIHTGYGRYTYRAGGRRASIRESWVVSRFTMSTSRL